MKNPLGKIRTKVPSGLRNPYVIALSIFVAWLLFFDRNNLISQYELRKELSNMTVERDFYRAEIQKDSTRLRELMSNPESLEKFARETYLMKKENEDIFVVTGGVVEKD